MFLIFWKYKLYVIIYCKYCSTFVYVEVISCCNWSLVGVTTCDWWLRVQEYLDIVATETWQSFPIILHQKVRSDFLPVELIDCIITSLIEVQKIVHPQKLTWNLEMIVSNRNLLFQGSIFRFHVCFGWCTVWCTQKQAWMDFISVTTFEASVGRLVDWCAL